MANIILGKIRLTIEQFMSVLKLSSIRSRIIAVVPMVEFQVPKIVQGDNGNL